MHDFKLDLWKIYFKKLQIGAEIQFKQKASNETKQKPNGMNRNGNIKDKNVIFFETLSSNVHQGS